VRWLDGEFEGLEEWIPKQRLLCPWDEGAALVRDERCMLAALAASGDVSRTNTYAAAELVLSAWSPAEQIHFGFKSFERELLVIEHAADTCRELGLLLDDLTTRPYAYLDRSGAYHAPFSVAVELVQWFCQRAPSGPLASIRAEEEALHEALATGYYTRPDFKDGYQYTRERAEDELRACEPVHRLVRDWCGAVAEDRFDEIRSLRSELDRLTKALEDIVEWLQSTGNSAKARQMLRIIKPTLRDR
jgi:hypothetical protein